MEQLALPFDGFYESHIDMAIDAEAEYLLDTNPDAAIAVDYDGIASDYTAWLFCEVYGCTRTVGDMMAAIITLKRPREYNFRTDEILLPAVYVQRHLPNLNLEYFREHGLLQPTFALIEEWYTSRDGYISFVNPQPTPEAVFTYGAYLEAALRVYTAHLLSCPIDDVVFLLAKDFISYANLYGMICDHVYLED